MTQTAPAVVPYEAFQHERALRIKAEHERDTYKNELFLLRKLRRAPVLKPVGKAVLEEFRHVEKWGTVKAPDGSTRANYTTIAKNLNTSPDTVARQAERLEKLGLVEIHEHQGPKDEGDRKYVHVKEEKLASIEQLEDPEDIMPKQGGNRYACQKCGSTRVAKRTVTSLKCLEAECGHESIIRDSGWIEQNVQEAQKQHAFDDSTLADDDTEDEQKQNAEHCVYTLPYDEQVADDTSQKQVAFEASASIADMPDIPPYLDGRIWICWRWEKVKGKWTKVPYLADMKGETKIDVTDLGKGRTFAYARECYQVSGSWKKPFDGIGFLCDGSFVGIDLDHCRDKETGEIAPWAQAIIDRFPSYGYVTPSEEGVRILIRAKKPGPRCKKGDIEIYEKNRFFTWTPDQLPGTPLTLADGQEAIEALYHEVFPAPEPEPPTDQGPLWNGRKDSDQGDQSDEEIQAILDKAMHARNGAKFALLHAGQWQEVKNSEGGQYYSSQSEAEKAYCSMLTYWGGSVSTIDCLYRQSGLYRPKWERKDYRENTIKRALSMVAERQVHA